MTRFLVFACAFSLLAGCFPRIPRPYLGELRPKLHRPDGSVFTLESTRSRVVMINFWASWCKSCMAEMKALANLAESLSPEELTILAVLIDDSPEKLSAPGKIESENFILVREGGKLLREKFSVKSLPTTVFVDCRGDLLKIVDPLTGENTGKILDAREWDSVPVINRIKGQISSLTCP